MRRLRVPFALFWCVAAGLQAQELDRPLRAVHLSGNWGHTADAVELWEMDRTQRLVPLRFVEYLRSVQVDWVGFSVALHLEHSMDSTLERTYSRGTRSDVFRRSGPADHPRVSGAWVQRLHDAGNRELRARA